MSEKITAADAIRLLDAHEAAAVDVREPDEFAVGHIPGAKLLPLGQVLSRALRCCRIRTLYGWSTAAPAAAVPMPCASWKALATPACTIWAAS